MKLNSIFRKWLLALACMTGVMLLLLTVAISWVVQRDFYKQELNRLDDRAFSVETAYGELSRGVITEAGFRKELKRIEQENKVHISIVGRKLKYFKQELYEVGVRPDVKSWIVTVSEGERIRRIARFRQQDEKMLIIGFPLNRNGDAAAAAFIYSSVADAKQLAAPVRRSIWLVAGVCAGPLAALLYLAARRFVRPIQRMSTASVSIAGGDFTSRVDIRGSDEIAKLGESFNRMAERIERVEEQRRKLIMDIAHELRTPLTSIRGTLQALADGIMNESEQKEFAELSLAELKRLNHLIDTLHELSAFEEHQIVYDRKRIDFQALVRDVVRQLRHKAEERGIRLKEPADGPKQLMLLGDPRRLRQVVLNLAGNAIDHNPAETMVEFELKRMEDCGIAELEIRDNGRGIADEHLPHLFERLYKADSSRASKGTGLGLTISRYIVQAHGGTITVQSKLGEGTTLKVSLPILRI